MRCAGPFDQKCLPGTQHMRVRVDCNCSLTGDGILKDKLVL